MKNQMKNKIKLVILTITMLFSWSCTDLEEQVLDESLTGSVSEDEIVTSVVAPAYALLPRLFLHTHLFCLQIYLAAKIHCRREGSDHLLQQKKT